MLATLADAPLADPAYVYEPKYDGIRAIAEVAAGPGGGVRLWSRLGNEKTSQFPEIAAALTAWARRQKEPLVLDGEIVALDGRGEPTGFQRLQGRIHVSDAPSPSGRSRGRGSSDADGGTAAPVAFIVFDLLRKGRSDLRGRPLVERRAALEQLFQKPGTPILRISEQVAGDGRALYRRALDSGWEGLIAKCADSVYQSGKRSPDWRKLKIVQEQEFVIGGWTEPRQSRMYFGALLLGVYEAATQGHKGNKGHKSFPSPEPPAASPERRLVYVGHTGTGFDQRELARVMKLLQPLETTVCPFANRPKTNERPHWVEPRLIAQIKFTEWTDDRKLRHPVYLGLRDDKKPQDVVREPTSAISAASKDRLSPRKTVVASGPSTGSGPSRAKSRGAFGRTVSPEALDKLVAALQAIEDSRKDGVIELPDGERLPVTNLHKVFWPKQKFTKGDLFRYYAKVAPFVLPAVAERPLVMKRFPNGIAAKPFYQHRVQDVPPGVRVETVAVAETRPQIIGGQLKTLLYTTQLAAISQDPWFSRVQSPQYADHVALDLDPSEGVPFSRVLDVARWIHDELETLGAEGFPKTSGSDGLHIYIPLPPETPYDAGLLFCQIVATVVTQKHPREATIERTVNARGRRVYIDCLQNILGKTLATAYSARASDYAGVSTPLTWKEVHDGVRREDFTIVSVPARVNDVGDLWKGLLESPGIDLSRVARYQQ